MIIIDNSIKEIDFCTKTSEFIGSEKLRIFEIDFEYTMFVHYYSDGIHLDIARNNDGPIGYSYLGSIKRSWHPLLLH